MNKLLVIGAVVLALILGDVAPGTAAAPDSRGLAQYAVVIVIDGCRADYLDLAPMPNLRYLQERGTTYELAWVGQLPSNTPPSHATLGTGVFPARHHVVGFNWRDPVSGAATYPSRIENLRRGSFSRIIREAKVPTIFNLFRSRHPGAKTLAMSSVKPYAACAMGNWSADYILFTPAIHEAAAGEEAIRRGFSTRFECLKGHDLPSGLLARVNSTLRPYERPGDYDTWVVNAFLEIFAAERPRLTMLNLPETDSTGHHYGGISAPESMRPIMQNVDRLLGRIIEAYRKAGILERTLFVVTADHGMVANRRNISAASYLPALLRPDHWPASSPLVPYIWLRRPEMAERAATEMAALGAPGIEAVFYKGPEGSYHGASALPEPFAQAASYLLGTLACPNSPDLFLFIQEEAIIGRRLPLNQRGKHYGATWEAQHIPLVLSGPGVRAGLRSPAAARLVDIPPTLLTLLGCAPAGMDGLVLADALEGPAASDAAANPASARLASLRSGLMDFSRRSNAAPPRSSMLGLWPWLANGVIFLLIAVATYLGARWVASRRAKVLVLATGLLLALACEALFLWGMRLFLEI